MVHYIFRRLLLIIPVLLGVSVIVFVLLLLFSPEQRATVFVTDIRQLHNIQAVIKQHGLDAPFYVQYFRWISQVFQGNLGWSKTAQRPVLEAFFYFLPTTAELALFSAPLIIFVGMHLGTISAVHKDKPIDHVSRVFSIVGWSLPTFWLGLVLLMIFYGYFSGLLPPEELGIKASLFVKSQEFIRFTRINTIDALLNGKLWIFVDALRHLLLPVVTLTVVNCAMVMRIMRSSMLEALGKGYVMTARAKGADEKTVRTKHARRNAMIPVVTVSGYIFALLMSGMVITETIFNRKGLGWWWANAATQLDIPAVLGAVLFNGVLFVLTNLIVDLLYAYFDPRIRLG
ncbi:ABC transporter permease [Candidatus Aerophobetes bacterium]|nr:ABC transporter permease [Candidatus Aerophobetes bacterium]